MTTLDDCYPWQPGGCEWTIQYLWHWMSSFGRLDVLVLTLMLVYLLAVVIHVRYCYSLARRTLEIDGARSRTVVARLNIELGGVKSIALIAPYFGLVGTCEGILSAFGGVGMEKHAALVMIATRMALALIPTAVAMPVAVLATCSYNSLRTGIDLLEAEVFDGGQLRSRHFRGARRFPPTKQFSALPAFGLLASPVLAIATTWFMTFGSFHTPVGFYVELASARCEYDVGDRLVVLHITEAGKLFLNEEQEDWGRLAGRLSEVYTFREDRTLYLVADSGVPFKVVADALDTAGKNELNIKVRLVTPKAFRAGCPQPVAADSGNQIATDPGKPGYRSSGYWIELRRLKPRDSISSPVFSGRPDASIH